MITVKVAEKPMVPTVSIVGRSNAGKTTYLEKLISELKNRGYRVATIKHAAHGFDIDRPGKDSWRHARAGSDLVCISSPRQFAMIKKVEEELPLEEVLTHISGVDIVLIEGYKDGTQPKIEVFRREAGSQPLCREEELLAMAADVRLYDGVPHFGLEDAASMAEFIRRVVLKAEPGSELN